MIGDLHTNLSREACCLTHVTTRTGGPRVTTDTRTSITREDLGAAIPVLDGTLRLEGLEAPVEIVRDHLGIPHIRAGSVADAFFAQGFVHAQDRLWHMEYDRRRAAGRWAEYVGQAAVDQDVLKRRAWASPPAPRPTTTPSTPRPGPCSTPMPPASTPSSPPRRSCPIEFRLLGGHPRALGALALLRRLQGPPCA